MATSPSASEEIFSLDMDTPTALRASPLLRKLQERSALCKVRTPAGDEAWLVTRHAEVKELLLDERLGRAHPDPENAPRYVDNPLMNMHSLNDNDPEVSRKNHAKVRAMMLPDFSARRARVLAPKLESLAETLLDEFIEKNAQPADLHTGFAVPYSLLSLCALIGVPVQDRSEMEAMLHGAAKLGDEDTTQGMQTLFGYMIELAHHKRARPEDDILSHLIELGADDTLAGTLSAGLMFAGLAPFAGRTEVGVVLLSTYRDQCAMALADPAMLASAVEEILRTAISGSMIMPKYASADIQVGETTIRNGEMVLFDFTLANYDPRVFEDPDKFDITRSPNPHLSFSPGVWHCVGAPLVRVMLAAIYKMIFTRLPELRLTIPMHDLELLEGKLAGSFKEVPVTW